MKLTVTSLPTYDAYKDSKVDWLGKIPESWDSLSNKYIFKLKKDVVGKKHDNYELLSLTLLGVIKRDMENPEGKFPADFETYQKIEVGDFIFCFFDVEETPRTIGLSDFSGMITGAYTVFDTFSDFDKKYLYYFYLNLDLGKRLKPLYRGLRNTIPKEKFLGFKTFIPYLQEQTAIANFLDKKTDQIDKVIAIKEQQIVRLKEYQQITIQKVVTQGLNPNIAMKDTDIEWIGKIPEHWEVKKLKFLAKINNGQDYKHIEAENGYPVIGSGGQFAFAKHYLYDGEAILLGRKGTIDKPLYINTKFWIVDTMFFCVCKKHICTKYVYYCAITIPFSFYVTSTALPSMTQSALLNHKFAIPSFDEQKEIVNYIEAESKKIEKTIELQQLQIEKLKEYKTTLINSAVTGKIKVV